MATRATISYFDEGTKKYHSIYSHWDGHLEWVGKVLKEHYSSLDKVKELIALGSISSLGARIVPIGKHSFDEREKGTTVAYHRDRGDEWVNVSPLVTSKLKKGDRQDFNYLFENGEWKYITDCGKEWQPVP
jgi:hypothetical protein